jgi:putative ABC transport system permease protein
MAMISIRTNKLRSALTALGIIIGVAAVIVVVSLIQGLRIGFMRQVQKAGSQTIFIEPVQLGSIPEDEFRRIQNRDLTMEDIAALIRTTPQIQGATPIFQMGTQIKGNGKSAQTSMLLTDETYLEQNEINLLEGRGLVPADVRLASKVAIVGTAVLEKLGIKGRPLGRIISTPTLALEIVGVLESQGATLGYNPDDRILIPITTGFTQLSSLQQRQLSFQVQMVPTINTDDSVDLLEDNLKRIKGVGPRDREGFQVYNSKQIAKVVNGITALITGVASSMVSVALLVGGIGIMNIMLVTVTERTREIGVRRAIGARRHHILMQFLLEALVISLLGGTIGILLGFTIGAALTKYMVNEVTGIPLWSIAAGVGVPVLVGLTFGLYPAAKASNLNPIDSLRYE